MELDELPPKVQLARLLAEKARRLTRRKLLTLYPDTGALRRELYPKHIAFLNAGATHRIRMMMAANRVGKTEGCGLYEVVLHMTGRYPTWWEGKRFKRPVKVWVAGDTGKTLREILQVKLLGAWGDFGTGLIPGDDLVKWTAKAGVAESVDTFTVRHVGGGLSHGVFKSYDQKALSFQGSEQDVILLDEECGLDIFGECLIRTATTAGIIMLTFTPLLGMTKLIKHMRESGVFEIGATWDDVPHLTEETKNELWANTPPHMRDARAKGVPARGSGVVFPISEQSITVETGPVPRSWPAIGGLDFGWDHPSAAVKMVHNREDDILYVVGCHRAREQTPLMFAVGVKPWGQWLPWAWGHDGLQHDKGSGVELAELYRKQGMKLTPNPASFSDDKLDNGVEAGIMGMLDMMQAGRFKVMAHLTQWFEEFRDYYRDEGVIVKERDDLISATRYAYMMRRFSRVRPSIRRDTAPRPINWRTL